MKSLESHAKKHTFTYFSRDFPLENRSLTKIFCVRSEIFVLRLDLQTDGWSLDGAARRELQRGHRQGVSA